MRAQIVLLAFLLAVLEPANGSAFLKEEPPAGALYRGQHVFVDDGSCPVGQVKELIGGDNRKYVPIVGSEIRRRGTPRSRHCISR
jgi:hypothetical protein